MESMGMLNILSDSNAGLGMRGLSKDYLRDCGFITICFLNRAELKQVHSQGLAGIIRAL